MTGLQPLKMGRNIHIKRGRRGPRDLIVSRTCRPYSQGTIYFGWKMDGGWERKNVGDGKLTDKANAEMTGSNNSDQ